MKILVTGGAGFIGSHLCDALLAEGYDVTAVDNFSPHYKEEIKRENIRGAQKQKNFMFFQSDITDRNAIGEIISSEHPETVVHLAAAVGSRLSIQNPYPYYQVNITGTQRVIDACIQSSVRRLILASSGSIYQGPSDTPFHESDTPPQPFTPYSMTKRMNEMMGQTCCSSHDIHITALRIFTTYGPRQRPDMAIHKFFRMAHQNRTIPVLETPRGRRDYIYIDDCIRGIIKSIVGIPGFEIINIGSGIGVDLSTLIGAVEETVGKEIVSENIQQPAGDWEGGAADISKARELIQFQPQITFEEGIARFYYWFRENP